MAVRLRFVDWLVGWMAGLTCVGEGYEFGDGGGGRGMREFGREALRGERGSQAGWFESLDVDVDVDVGRVVWGR